MWWFSLVFACVTYRTSIQIFPLPRQHIELNKPPHSRTGHICLSGLVNVEQEPVYWEDNGDVTFGPKVAKAMQKYRCNIYDIRQDQHKIVLHMSILRIPHKVVLKRDETCSMG